MLGTGYLEVPGMRLISLARIVGPVGIGMSGADTRSIVPAFVLTTGLPAHRNCPFWYPSREYQKQDSTISILGRVAMRGARSDSGRAMALVWPSTQSRQGLQDLGSIVL